MLMQPQVMGAFEAFVGPWFLRLGNVNMSQAILELCGVPQDARSIVSRFVCLAVFLAVRVDPCVVIAGCGNERLHPLHRQLVL